MIVRKVTACLRWGRKRPYVGTVCVITFIIVAQFAYNRHSSHAGVTSKPSKSLTPRPSRSNDATAGEDHFCSFLSPWSVRITTSKTLTDFTKWDFQNLVECPRFDVGPLPGYRSKLSLDCSDGPKMLLSKTNDSSDVFQVNFGDKCLQRVIDTCCSDKKPVPNVVHYVWYSNAELGYFQFLSFMSALRYIRPCLFLIHGEFIPRGKYWNLFIQLSPNVIHVKRPLITHAYGHKLAFKEHGSDLMRIEGLYEYGGMYLDWDEIVLKSLEPLRQYEHTQGLARADFLGSQLIMLRFCAFGTKDIKTIRPNG